MDNMSYAISNDVTVYNLMKMGMPHEQIIFALVKDKEKLTKALLKQYENTMPCQMENLEKNT